MLKLCKMNLNPCVVMLAAGMALMVLSAISIDVASVADENGIDQFDVMTTVSLGDLSIIELMSEFTLPLAFICGAFLAAGGMSGWLLFKGRNSLNCSVVS